MSEADAIRGMEAPVTQASLAADLRRLGLPAGGVVLAHTRLSALGWVCGGPQAVVGALLDALGPEGTLVVPTHTGGNSEPSQWQAPPVPESWWPVIRAEMPAFDPAVSPARGIGVVVEVARTWRGALRSAHPIDSFAAIGPRAAEITDGHALDSGLGERSPLARVHDLDGHVLLLGAGHGSNTSMHLAEHRVPSPRRERHGAAVMGPEGRRWATWEDVVADADDFEALGAAFEATGAVTTGSAGAGTAKLMRQRELVAFAVEWLAAHRPG